MADGPLQPVRPDDRWTAAMRRGDFPAAWELAAAGMAERDGAGRDDPGLPYHLRWVWDGTPVDGAEVLVRCYHGLGDTVMFARFLPLLATRAASVTVEMQPRLIPLFEAVEGVRLVPFDVTAPLPPLACTLEIMDLPLALRAGPADVPLPYLAVPPAALPEGTVALCWQGGDWDPDRSISEALLAPLWGGATLSLVAAPTALPVLNPEGCPMDLPQTAALIAGSALVITVDTMAAHLAGAMGRTVWLMAKHSPDWRWPVEAEATPWYPTMRVYRQPAPGDWPSVIARVAGDLTRLREDRQ